MKNGGRPEKETATTEGSTAPPFRTREALPFPEEPVGRSPGRNLREGRRLGGSLQIQGTEILSYFRENDNEDVYHGKWMERGNGSKS